MLLLFYNISARAQVTSGTIIIFTFSKDQIAIAADSLAGNSDTGIPDYSHCKTAAFKHQVIFTTVGNSGWYNPTGKGPVQAWDNIELARNAIHHERGCCDDLDSIATRWAKDVKSHWDLIDQLDRRRAVNIASADNGQLTAGVFVGRGLATKLVVIEYDENKPIDPVEIKMGDGDGISNCWPCGQLQGGRVCGAGHHLDVAAKFCSERKRGDRIDTRTPLKGASDNTKLAVKIVELTIDAYEKPVGDVGGKVDAITVNRVGVSNWNSRKPNCPANQD